VSEDNAECCNNSESILKHGGEPKPDDATGLCLLSLDGGGVQGLSSLYILKSITDALGGEI
jgi:hypothetical protein